jgi:hypothetical protein
MRFLQPSSNKSTMSPKITKLIREGDDLKTSLDTVEANLQDMEKLSSPPPHSEFMRLVFTPYDEQKKSLKKLNDRYRQVKLEGLWPVIDVDVKEFFCLFLDVEESDENLSKYETRRGEIYIRIWDFQVKWDGKWAVEEKKWWERK